MRRRVKQVCAVLMSVCLFTGGTTPVLSEATSLSSGRSTQRVVTNSSELLEALAAKVSLITVQGSITLSNGEASDKRMLPVKIPANTTIQGGEIIFRSPVQIDGDQVEFRDMSLHFNSSDAMGSVPHREIFLAGHSLTLDNVDTYLAGASGSLGGFGGTEKELLPTVYGGAFTGSSVGSKAELTIRNANNNTILQGIYMGNDAESDEKVPYTGVAEVSLDANIRVRDGIHTDKNSSAVIQMQSNNRSARVDAYYGNEGTTLQVENTMLEDCVLDDVGNVVLDKKAILQLKNGTLHNVEVKNGSALDVTSAKDAVITGSFVGGAENESQDTTKRGYLVGNENGTVTIKGDVTGVTWFQTKAVSFPGKLQEGTAYIYVKQSKPAVSNFVISDRVQTKGLYLHYANGAWSVIKEEEAPFLVSRMEVSYPQTINKKDMEDVFFQIRWYDEKNQVVDSDTVEQEALYEKIIWIKKEYWQSKEQKVLEKTDWGVPVYLEPSENGDDKYFLRKQGNIDPGDYTALFFPNGYDEDALETVADVQAQGANAMKEIHIKFVDGTVNPSEIPGPSEAPEPSETAEPTREPQESALPSMKPATAEPTKEPSIIPEPTREPQESALPSMKPVPPTVEPTKAPNIIPEPTQKPSAMPEPSATKEPSITPEPTKAPASIPQETKEPQTSQEPVASVNPEPTQNIQQDRIYPFYSLSEMAGTDMTQEKSETSVAIKLKLANTSYIYNGKEIKPKVTVKDKDGKVLPSSYYTVTYKNNKNVGIATVIVKCKDKYKGQLKQEFTILPKGTSFGKEEIKTGAVLIKWKKQEKQTAGYVLQYSTNPKFVSKGTKTIWIKGKAIQKNIKKLQTGKNYYVRIRTYQNIKKSGKTQKLYSNWSDTKTVTVKK